jgi:hypothetical protein
VSQINQMSRGFLGLSTNAAIRGLLDNPSDASLRTLTVSALTREVSNRRMEFATLLDADGVIVANANRNRSGEAGWDPAVGGRSIGGLDRHRQHYESVARSGLVARGPVDVRVATPARAVYAESSHPTANGSGGIVPVLVQSSRWAVCRDWCRSRSNTTVGTRRRGS